MKQKSSNMQNNKWDHGVNREYMAVCVQLTGTLNIRGRGVDLMLHTKLLQSCQTLCDPRDCTFPGSSVHGILQARILEWVAISFSRRSSLPRDRTLHLQHLLHWQVDYLPLAPPGKSSACPQMVTNVPSRINPRPTALSTRMQSSSKAWYISHHPHLMGERH